MIHCCGEMESAVADLTIPLVFTANFREFGVRILDGGTSTLHIGYCPWCGQKLPASLRNSWFDKLESLGIDPYGNSVPAEWSDESWYSSRTEP